MKKYLLLTAVSSLLLASCNSEMDSVVSGSESGLQTRSMMSENADFQIINYGGENCVQFKNDSTYRAMLMRMQNMSESEILLSFSGAGFVSQEQLMNQADQEQEAIVDNYEKDLNQPFPYQQIAAFKQKYNDVFMFNPHDSTDFIAYYRVENPLHRAFVNRKGIFLVGNEEVHSPMYTTEEYFGSEIMPLRDNVTTDEATTTNRAESQFQIPDGDFVKVRAIPQFVANEKISGKNYKVVGFDLLSQKRKALWKKHHARISLKVNAKGSGEGFAMFNKAMNRFEDQNGKDIMLYADVYDKLNASDGAAAGHVGENINKSPRFEFTGRMEIWSNEIPEDHKGTSKINLSE